jgi:hypothetical protein
MSLDTFSFRPTVKFDVTNADHRRWLGEFTRTRAWGNCPVRFSTAGNGNTVAQMQLRLLEYYTNQEFTKA